MNLPNRKFPAATPATESSNANPRVAFEPTSVKTEGSESSLQVDPFAASHNPAVDGGGDQGAALAVTALSPSLPNATGDGNIHTSHALANEAGASLSLNELVTLLDPAPGPRDGWRIEEANRRLKILQAFIDLVAEGKSKAAAAKIIGQPYTSLWRWKTAYEAKGYNGLLPDTDKSGRKSALEKLGLTAETVQQLMSEVKGLNLDTESNITALRLFAHSDRCPEALANLILDPKRCSKHAIPPSLRNATSVKKNERDVHRGGRTLNLQGIYIPRRLDVLPGDIFVPDDTTPIFGWWVPWVECEEYPFGVKLLQGQLLRIIDVASQFPVGKVLIAREKSSYRASDIWSWVGFMADDVGLPRLGFQMERGSWDSNLLQGVEVEYTEGDVTHSRRVGGLRELPANITAWHREKHGEFFNPKTLQTWTSYLPKSKTIEAYFHRVQQLEGCLYGSLGRDQMRRPYEKAKKLFQQCSRPKAKIDPRHHFLSGTEIMARLGGMDDFLAGEPMEGEIFKGIPRLNFQNALSEFPLYRLPEDRRWLYRSDWKCVPITRGWARVRLTDAAGERFSLFYGNPQVFAEIEGKDVVVYYDRERFEQLAQIIAASSFTVRGQQYRPGDYVCEADFFERPGMFLDGDRNGHDIRKKWRNAVMTIYGSSAIHAPSRQLPPEIAARRAHANLPAPATTVDGRPAAAPVQRRGALKIPSPEEFTKRGNALAEQAAIANNLRNLQKQT